MALTRGGAYQVQCSGGADGVRCPVTLDAATPDAVRYCMSPDCRKDYERDYARRPEAKAKNLRRVHRRRYGRAHICDACRPAA